MGLVTCPFCGSVFHVERRNCPNCTYRVPADLLSPDEAEFEPDRHRPAVMERTRWWLRHAVDCVQSAFVHRH